MRMTQTLIPTLKEIPQGAEIPSHILMIRAGLIRKLAAGAYIYMPLGVRSLRKVERIIREEMDRAGALEILMPALQPTDLWKKTGRYETLGEDMVRFVDRHGKEAVLGPTHEEVVTDLASKEIRSYRQLPITLYQIQTKFRDEMRPRFGVMRSREFIMKDAYSFNLDEKDLDESYKKMYDAYRTIFDRCGLKYLVVEADAGVMGGNVSHEFMVLSPNGEDMIAHCHFCGYAANLEKMECPERPSVKEDKRGADEPFKEVKTPDVTTIEKVSDFLKKRPDEMVKTLIYRVNGKPAAFLLRGDHDLNESKVKSLLNCKLLEMAGGDMVLELTGGPVGFSGPVGLKGMKVFADNCIKDISGFVTGANKKDVHLVNVNHGRDFKVDKWGDIRRATKDDLCPKCGKGINIEYAIEVGHTFKLGDKYSKSLGAKVLDEAGKERTVIMGCYGIGVNRIIAACIENSHDKDGIIWPMSISPYQVEVIALNMSHQESVDIAEGVYRDLTEAGIEVLYDDRQQERAGIKFKDADLIGIPVQVVIGERALGKGGVELKTRHDKNAELVPVPEIMERVKKLLTKL